MFWLIIARNGPGFRNPCMDILRFMLGVNRLMEGPKRFSFRFTWIRLKLLQIGIRTWVCMKI